uniref:NADPH:adrenodoxin oxidoreductase, mitochondrial n=1 Tax=Timema cristinae TaxID=61476 RepID=A0A7R9GQU1_TIMCR|nr:unnamed protein product [Timema cristinae]
MRPLKRLLPNAQVDIYESMPVPFGLVRFGVAPDHPEVKNVINTFTKTARNPNVRFIGNVSIGRDVSLDELRHAYHAVLLTYGADQDRALDIPGENLGNVISARRFVGWYNGLPWDRNLNVNLDVEVAAILGQGNVALDIARILLTPIDKLRCTDITEHALAALSKSRVKRVLMIGRRGPLQVAFTIKELREMVNLPECGTVMNPQEFVGVPEVIPCSDYSMNPLHPLTVALTKTSQESYLTLARPRRRLTELLCKTALEPNVSQGTKSFCPMFLRTPKRFLPHPDNQEVVGGIELIVNRLEGPDLVHQRAMPTEEVDTVECGLALRSIGYRSVKADPKIPFDDTRGRVRNSNGVIEPGLYSAGWLATGPMGVILSTMNNAFTVAQTIAKDFKDGVVDPITKKSGFQHVCSLLKDKGVQWVSFSDWEKIDQVEKERGARLGKPREKIVDIKEMLSIAGSKR